MRPKRYFLAALILGLVGLYNWEGQAQANRASFPKNFDEYVLYATYDRGASKEEAFATRETLAIAKLGQPLPPGTQLVLGIWSNNALTGYFVMEKGVGWGRTLRRNSARAIGISSNSTSTDG
jgi:hypothetical protein